MLTTIIKNIYSRKPFSSFFCHISQGNEWKRFLSSGMVWNGGQYLSYDIEKVKNELDI